MTLRPMARQQDLAARRDARRGAAAAAGHADGGDGTLLRHALPPLRVRVGLGRIVALYYHSSTLC